MNTGRERETDRPGHVRRGRSQRKAAGRATSEETRAWYRRLVERVPAVLYVDASDEISSTVYVSPQTEGLLGYSREEWLEDPELWVKTLHPADKRHVLAAHERARETGRPFREEYRLIAKDRRVVWVRDEAEPVENEGTHSERRIGILLDVTERKQAEEALLKSEERFRLVAKATGEAIWDNDFATGRQEWDGATEALFGYPPHQGKTGTWWEERIHPDDRERILSSLDDVLASDSEESWEEEYRFRRSNGTYAHVADRGHVVRDRHGEPVRMVGAMADITERKRAEEALRQSEERYRLAFDCAPVSMAHVAPEGRFLRVNDRYCEASGYGRDELLSMDWQDITPPEDLQAVLGRVHRMLEGKLDHYTTERRHVRKDGTRVWVNLSVSLVRRPSGELDHLVCVADDITAQKLGELVPDPLTVREIEVLGEIVAGRTDTQISRDLTYSLGTVKLDVRHILAKLGVEDRKHAAAQAVEIGLVAPAGCY